MDTVTIRERDGDYVDVCITHKTPYYETNFWFNQTIQRWKRFFEDCKSKNVAALTSENMGTYVIQEIYYNGDLCLYSHNVNAKITAAPHLLAEMEKVVLG